MVGLEPTIHPRRFVRRWPGQARPRRNRKIDMASKPSVFIDGESGTTGLGIRDRLQRAPRHRTEEPSRRPAPDPAARRDIMAEVDLVVLCLPDDAAREFAALADGLGNDGAENARRQHRASCASGLGIWLPGNVAGPGRAHRRRAKGRQSRLLSHRRHRPGASAGGCRHASRRTIRSPSTRSAATPAAARPMIEAHEHDSGPAFELYALRLEHKHLPETAALLRPLAAADLRALGGPLPPGDAGLGAAASGHAARQTHRRGPAGGAGGALPGLRVGPRHPPPANGKLEPEALNDTEPAGALRPCQREAPPGGAGRAARQPRQGRVRRGGAEHSPDARPARRRRAAGERRMPEALAGPGPDLLARWRHAARWRRTRSSPPPQR